jgi:uncharacterized membrane protein
MWSDTMLQLYEFHARKAQKVKHNIKLTASKSETWNKRNTEKILILLLQIFCCTLLITANQVLQPTILHSGLYQLP